MPSLVLEDDISIVVLAGLDSVSSFHRRRDHRIFRDLQSMDNTRDITKYSEENIDQEVGVAATFEKDTKGRNEDGEDDLADVTIVELSQLSSGGVEVRMHSIQWSCCYLKMTTPELFG